MVSFDKKGGVTINGNTKKLIRTSLFLAVAIVFQIIGRNVPQINQFMVGPVVNAILLLTTFICGIFWGAAIGILTPLLALLVGQLAAPLGFFVPFIMIGNFIFVICFGILMNKGKWGKYAGIAAGAILKFFFLSFASSKLIGMIGMNVPKKVLAKLMMAMSTPQLVTALIGGIIALVFIEILNRRHLSDI